MFTIFKIGFKNIYFSYAWVVDYLYVIRWQLKSIPRIWPRRTFIVEGAGRPVLMIPGIYENWRFMLPLVDSLKRHGFQVHVVTKLGYNAGSIESMAALVIDYMTEHDLRDVSLVAHSKGGLIAKYVLMQQPSYVKKVIAINTPFNGSFYARFFFLKEVRVFSKTSASLRRLSAAIKVNDKIISLYSRFDPHIPEGSKLDGARNIVFKKVGHFSPVGDKDVHTIVIKQLNG